MMGIDFSYFVKKTKNMKNQITTHVHFCTILGSHFVVLTNNHFGMHKMIRISKNKLKKSIRMYKCKKSSNSNKDFKFWHPS